VRTEQGGRKILKVFVEGAVSQLNQDAAQYDQKLSQRARTADSPFSSRLMSNILTVKWTWLSLQIILRQLNNLVTHTYAYVLHYYK
jgi:hypothetical protein